MIRKKTLRLLHCDYQRTVRYYTIYRTFKCLSSDDFTTIPEAATTIPAGTLRLLLTSIGYRAKARKEMRRQAASGSAPPDWHSLRCVALSGMDPRQGRTPLHPYIPYYNRAAVLTCAASGVAVVSGMCWRCSGAVICSSVAQAVQYSRMHRHITAAKQGE